MHLSFENIPLTSLNTGAFQQLFADVTLQGSVSLGLHGTANVSAKTSIGNVPISGVPFDVTSQLRGLSTQMPLAFAVLMRIHPRHQRF